MRNTIKLSAAVLVFAPVLAVWAFSSSPATVMAQPADPASADARYREQSLRVSVWLNKDADEVYRRGEALEVTFQTNEDAYAVIYHIDVDGLVEVIWPTSRFSDGFVFGGHQYRLPSRDGDRLRTGDDEGVGYFQAVVSRYPFDLRDLELDFHHEQGDGRFEYYVAGDPFLAMNEVTYAVTGLEDASEYVVTNYASYYVHRQVDHPRYLCSQCHDDDVAYEPYRDTCTVNIRFDYGWHNDWWLTFGYYPAYYYPTYYYIDPWTRYRWVNYWYDPWYFWPTVVVHDWDYHCYPWHDSPYWHGNSTTAWGHGDRRYRPLDKTTLLRDRDRRESRTRNTLVTGERPADDRLRAMKERVVAERPEGRGDDRGGARAPAGGTAGNVTPVRRSQERFEGTTRVGAAPGLKVPDRTAASGERTPGVRQPTSRSAGSERPARTRDDRLDDERPGTKQPRTGSQAIRPVSPREDGGRTWTGRRSSGAPESRPVAPPTRTENAPSSSRAGKPSVRGAQDDRSVGPRGERGPRNTIDDNRGGSSGPRGNAGSGSRGGSGGTSIQRPTKQPAPAPAPAPARPRSGGSSGGKTDGGSSRGGRSQGGRG
ncbi:MAG TPA: DUF4384 domain-containing protein [Candidatus Krumholzibacteria bacterium]|nr:DUF4384 domain-containing protein [Candidatus Krumholzibacteria bacterium]HPD71224.1 DUF4384 domain-containing protein [Candidatus Krumholzibacteria bacterium]HRY39076.1 DUF4384 domain-containing protein [Candidatus Krumholzibacteria bacterium]